ncbi:MAG: repeat domain protein [Myxococcaceae bacterium]|nr:repeat domain protein [Myxococcaceae bacterium]
MRGLQQAFIATGLAALGVVVVGLVDCAAPTQIVVEVYSDACPSPTRNGQSINSTGIAVGKPAEIEAKPPVAVRDTCEQASGPGVGTLTIYPSGANDEDVAIKVVAGVDVPADACRTPDYAGCIVHRRVVRFIPHTTQRLTVRLSLACLNRVCPAKNTCDNGVCKAETDLLPDGGTVADAAIQEAGFAEGGVIVDAGGPDACTGCKGTCSPTGCAVDCKTQVCDGTEQCSPTLPCTITCDGTGHCNDLHCTTAGKCTVTCGSPKTSCDKVTCNAGECDVTCNGADSCNGDGGIVLDAATKASLSCIGDDACNTASCNSPDCKLDCNPSSGSKRACPSPAPCTGGCADWNNPN